MENDVRANNKQTRNASCLYPCSQSRLVASLEDMGRIFENILTAADDLRLEELVWFPFGMGAFLRNLAKLDNQCPSMFAPQPPALIERFCFRSPPWLTSTKMSISYVLKAIGPTSKIFKTLVNESQGLFGTSSCPFWVYAFSRNNSKHLVDPKSRIMGLGDPWYLHSPDKKKRMKTFGVSESEHFYMRVFSK